ncbi:MAG: Na+-transporting NADH:ubiquinone oxidoreductase, subunit NqrB, partial [Thermosynechococcaceae cyanobacterium]
MFRDARDYQICFLSLFLALGVIAKDWTLQPLVIGTAILTCLTVQALASAIAIRPDATTPENPLAGWSVLRSALITGLSLSLLLRTDHWYTMAFAATVAILSKFTLRIQGKHIYNPANAGIIAALCLGQDAWVSPGQWGDLGWYALLFAGAGGVVLQRVGRWDTSVVFLGVYGGLLLLRDRWLGWS